MRPLIDGGQHGAQAAADQVRESDVEEQDHQNRQQAGSQEKPAPDSGCSERLQDRRQDGDGLTRKLALELSPAGKSRRIDAAAHFDA